MEENYRWISAVLADSGKRTSVRQCGIGSPVWEDNEGTVYAYSDLDFTKIPEEPPFLKDWKETMQKQNDEHEKTQSQLREMLSAMDARAIADHQAKIDERAYWRKLRGDIALEITRSKANDYSHTSSFTWIAAATKVVFEELYDQDKYFFNN